MTIEAPVKGKEQASELAPQPMTLADLSKRIDTDPAFRASLALTERRLPHMPRFRYFEWQ